MRNTFNNPKSIVSFIIILVFAFAIRMFFFSCAIGGNDEELNKAVLAADASGYHRYALNILNNGLIIEFEPKRTPGYPLFLAFIYRVFGVNLKVAAFFQYLLDFSAIFIIFLIARAIFRSNKIPLIAASLYAINPTYMYYSSRLISEPLFVFMFSLAVLSFVVGLKKNRIFWLAASGFIFGVATLIKPAYSFIPIVLSFIMLVSKDKFRKKVKLFLITIIFFVIPLSAWQARNLYFYGYYELYSNKGHFLHNRCVAEAIAYSENITFKEAFKKQTSGPAKKIKNRFERSKKYQALAKEYILKNPKTYLYVHLKGLKKFFFKEPKIPDRIKLFGMDLEKKEMPWIILFSQLYLEYLFFTVGIIFIFCRKDEKYARIYVLFVVMTLIIVASGASARGLTRYRYPLVPLYLVISSKGMFEAFNFLRKRLKSRP